MSQLGIWQRTIIAVGFGLIAAVVLISREAAAVGSLGQILSGEHTSAVVQVKLYGGWNCLGTASYANPQCPNFYTFKGRGLPFPDVRTLPPGNQKAWREHHQRRKSESLNWVYTQFAAVLVFFASACVSAASSASLS